MKYFTSKNVEIKPDCWYECLPYIKEKYWDITYNFFPYDWPLTWCVIDCDDATMTAIIEECEPFQVSEVTQEVAFALFKTVAPNATINPDWSFNWNYDES